MPDWHVDRRPQWRSIPVWVHAQPYQMEDDPISDPLPHPAAHASFSTAGQTILLADDMAVGAVPTWHELLAAFCGHMGDDAGDHPVTRWARSLAELHLRRDRTPLSVAEIDSRRAEFVAAIDAWVTVHALLPRAAAAQGLGTAVDRMAAAQVHANRLLGAIDDITDARVHAAWSHLASLADEWADLVATVMAGQPYELLCARTD